MRIRNGRLLQIFVHAASPALIAPFELDRDARAAVQLPRFRRFLRRGIRSGRIVRYPLNAVIGDVLPALFAGRNVFAFASAVDDLRLIPFGVDLNLEVMRRLLLPMSSR